MNEMIARSDYKSACRTMSSGGIVIVSLLDSKMSLVFATSR